MVRRPQTVETMLRVSSVALLVGLLADWYVVEGGVRSFNAWEVFPKFDVVLALVAVAALVSSARPSRAARIAQLALGGLALAIVVSRWLDPPAFEAIEPRAGLLIAGVAAFGIALSGAVGLRADAPVEPPQALPPGPSLRAFELVTVLVLLAALAVAVYGGYVQHAGLDTVGLSHAGMYHSAADPGFLGSKAFAQHLNYRPAAGLYIGLIHSVFGLHTSWHLGWAITLAVLMSLLSFAVLRVLRVGRLSAGVVALLVLIYPASSTVRLGSTHSIGSFTVVLYLAGLLLVLRGFREEGRRALPWHVGGSLLFLLSLLSYEITAGLVILGVLIYRLDRGAWRPALRRWVWDLIVLVVSLALVRLRGSVRPPVPFDDQLDHARMIFDQAIDLGAASIVPIEGPPIAGVVATVLLVVVAALATALLLPRTDARARDLLRWLGVALGAAILIAAAYAPFVPADVYYSPLQVAEANRVNTVAAVGFVLLLVATGKLVGTLAFAAVPRWRTAAAVTTACLAAVAAVGYLDWLGPEKRVALEASVQQRQIIGLFERRLPRLRDGTTVLLFGTPRTVDAGAGVTRASWVVFAESWDLGGTLKLVQRNRTLRAYAMGPDETVCDLDGAYHVIFGPSLKARYDVGVLALDAVSEKLVRLTDRRQCLAVTARLRSGAS